MKRFFLAIMTTLLAGCPSSKPEEASGLPAGCTLDVLLDGSMLYQKIFDAKPIRERPQLKAVVPQVTAGAKLYIRAEKGMTAAYLKRAADCHAASSEPPLSPDDPLRPPGARPTIRVTPRGSIFVLSVVGETREAGEAIWSRAQALLSGSRGD